MDATELVISLRGLVEGQPIVGNSVRATGSERSSN